MASDPEEPDFDLVAAGLRADGGELRISLEALAVKLAQALPGHTSVKRSGGGLFGRGERRVCELRVELGDSRYELAVDGDRVAGLRVCEVGGVAIRREPLDPGAWVAALTEELRAQAQRSEQAREALASLLG
ncbi:MAG TPA: hypothetical protein VEJ23_03760 [Solirubrobacteraceae bacterium]|nr:hypothetical protein [Solirubrobacteraceae bacterium]